MLEILALLKHLRAFYMQNINICVILQNKFNFGDFKDREVLKVNSPMLFVCRLLLLSILSSKILCHVGELILPRAT